MSDSSSIVCLDDLSEDEVNDIISEEQNMLLGCPPDEKLRVVVNYLQLKNNSRCSPPNEKQTFEIEPIVDNTNDHSHRLISYRNECKIESALNKSPITVIDLDDVDDIIEPKIAPESVLNDSGDTNSATNNKCAVSDTLDTSTKLITIDLDDSDDKIEEAETCNDDNFMGSLLLTPLYEVELPKHINNDGRTYQCKYCNMYFFHKQELLQHYKTHNKERREEKKNNMVSCKICKQLFKTEKDIKWHEPECNGRYLGHQSSRNSKRRVTRSSLSVSDP